MNRLLNRIIIIEVFILLCLLIIVALTGCAHDNGIIYKPAPKPSVMQEVDQGVKTIGGVARFLGLGADAK